MSFKTLFIYLIVSTVGLFGFITAQAQMDHNMSTIFDGILTEAGNDAFGTIQEVIARLEADPNTDWSKVNIEALREHLLDMNDMTFNVELLSQTAIENGLEIELRPTTARAGEALARVFAAHPAQLELETQWMMKVSKSYDGYKLVVTTDKPEDLDKIRGLGYIGLMAYGSHHQSHHWAIATGLNPHEQHNMNR